MSNYKPRGILHMANMFAADRLKEDDRERHKRIVSQTDELLGKKKDGPIGDIGFCGYICGREVRWKDPEE